METALALVHSRFSTNTFPSWDRAHPYRYIAHNGEINTLRGNINWMHAREALFESPLFGDDIKKISADRQRPNGSDSLDVRQRARAAWCSPAARCRTPMMMMIPEPWSKHESMDPARRAFYQYHSCLMEPWDGPAAIGFTDGKRDRRRARPQRPAPGALLRHQGRPGRHGVRGRRARRSRRRTSCARAACSRAACSWSTPSRAASSKTRRSSAQIVSERPYADWLKQHLVHLKDLPAAPELPTAGTRDAAAAPAAFGYTFEDQRILMAPMARDGNEAIGSMGNDTPLAVLSTKSRLLYDYFKQLFAQVTNPPIDCIREEIITSSRRVARLRRQPARAAARRLPPARAEGPGADERGVREDPRASTLPGLKVGTLSILFRAERGEDGLVEAIEELRAEAKRLIEEDEVNILILSDRGVNKDFAPIPSLLAVSRPASLPDPRGPAHEGVAGARDRRSARGASLRAADRLRRARHQSVPRLRDHRRHDPRRHAARTSTTSSPARTSPRPPPRASSR